MSSLGVGGTIGRLWSRLTGNLIGFGIGAASAQAFEPFFADLAAAAWEQHPARRLSAAELAQLEQRAELTLEEAAAMAAEVGVNRERFQLLTRLAGEPPTPAETLELLRRGAISREEALRSLEQGPLRREWHPALLELQRVLLSPPELAGLAARGIVPAEEAEQLAGRQGLEAEAFRALMEARRDEPALGELLELLRRGELTEAEAEASLRRRGVRAEHAPALLELQRQLPGIQDLIRFAVRDVFTPATRRAFGLDEGYPAELTEQAGRRGLEEEDARAYWAAHWELPSPTQAFTMFHRGLIDRQELERYMVAADFMPFWREGMLGISYLVPGRIDLRRMFQAGVIDRPRVLRGYLDLGYSPKDAEALTDFATMEQLEEERQLTKAEVMALYKSRAIPQAETVELLEGLGYDRAQSQLVIRLADYQRANSYRTQAITVVRGRFVAREIDERAATERLDRIGVPAEEREQLLDLWLFQREESPRRLTEAQARAAWKAGVLDENGYRQQLERMGYPADEVTILVELARPEAAPAAEVERDLTRADVLRFYRYGQWDRAQAQAGLLELGFSPVEAEALLDDIQRRYRQEAAPAVPTRDLTRADAVRLYKAGEWTRAQALRHLEELGYSPEEAGLILAGVQPKG